MHIALARLPILLVAVLLRVPLKLLSKRAPTPHLPFSGRVGCTLAGDVHVRPSQ